MMAPILLPLSCAATLRFVPQGEAKRTVPLGEKTLELEEFKSNIDHGFLLTIVPNLIGIGGTLFLGWGYLTAVALGAAFWLPQLADVMRPLYEHREKEQKK